MPFTPPASVAEIPTVTEMVTAMDRTVAGLEEFKLRLAVVLRDFMVAAINDRPWHPGNILILGPTGVGKSYSVIQCLRAIPVVWCEAAATEFSDRGYHGRDLPTMYLGLTAPTQREVRMVNGKVRRVSAQEHRGRAERWGVVLLDEFDKLRTNKTSVPGERQVGKVLQHELLKLVEGTETIVQESDDDRGFLFRTDHVLHIGMGAFEGINETIATFDKKPWAENLYEQTTPEDLVEYGFIQELMGRFATILTLPLLKSEQIMRILREQLVPQLTLQLADEGIELVVEDSGLFTIANEALQHAIGARSLEPLIKNKLWRYRKQARPGDQLILESFTDARLVRREAA